MINRTYKFIYVRVAKTGSESLRHILEKYNTEPIPNARKKSLFDPNHISAADIKERMPKKFEEYFGEVK